MMMKEKDIKQAWQKTLRGHQLVRQKQIWLVHLREVSVVQQERNVREVKLRYVKEQLARADGCKMQLLALT